jgi:hypothetical protein
MVVVQHLLLLLDDESDRWRAQWKDREEWWKAKARRGRESGHVGDLFYGSPSSFFFLICFCFCFNKKF